MMTMYYILWNLVCQGGNSFEHTLFSVACYRSLCLQKHAHPQKFFSMISQFATVNSTMPYSDKNITVVHRDHISQNCANKEENSCPAHANPFANTQQICYHEYTSMTSYPQVYPQVGDKSMDSLSTYPQLRGKCSDCGYFLCG